jgi:uncharacterized protein YlxP (DUF503 family)
VDRDRWEGRLSARHQDRQARRRPEERRNPGLHDREGRAEARKEEVEVIVGTLKIRLVLRESHSLKDKRRVIKSLKDTLSNKFNISVAETDEQDVWQTAEIGVASVGTDGPFVQSVLTNVVNYVRFFGGVELVDSEQEIYGD